MPEVELALDISEVSVNILMVGGLELKVCYHNRNSWRLGYFLIFHPSLTLRIPQSNNLQVEVI